MHSQQWLHVAYSAGASFLPPLGVSMASAARASSRPIHFYLLVASSALAATRQLRECVLSSILLPADGMPATAVPVRVSVIDYEEAARQWRKTGSRTCRHGKRGGRGGAGVTTPAAEAHAL